MPFFSWSSSDWSKMLNEHWKRLVNSSINIVYPWTFSVIEKQMSAHALLPVLSLPFMLNRAVGSTRGKKTKQKNYAQDESKNWWWVGIHSLLASPLTPGNGWKIVWFACSLSVFSRHPLITGCSKQKCPKIAGVPSTEGPLKAGLIVSPFIKIMSPMMKKKKSNVLCSK